ncbi:phage terminase large subunit family protein [Anaerobacillus sp. HL2]|nr:phage terminase large subunit family protein [Anaerobacillus sp. HL2]
MSNSDRAEFANYCCQECGCITDNHKQQMLNYGRWEIVEQKEHNSLVKFATR